MNAKRAVVFGLFSSFNPVVVMMLKKRLFLACFGVLLLILFIQIGCSWDSDKYNRIQFNVSSTIENYGAIEYNASFDNLGCQDTVYCNDTYITYLNGTPLYYSIERTNTSFATEIWIKDTSLITSSPRELYLYFNSSNTTKSLSNNGTLTFIRFRDFENETNLAGASDIGNFDGTLSLKSVDCWSGNNCVYNDGTGFIFGLLNSYSSGIGEMWVNLPASSTVGQYLGNGGTGGVWAGGYNIFPTTSSGVWEKIIIRERNNKWNFSASGVYYGLDTGAGSFGQFAIGYYVSPTTPTVDYIFFRHYLDEPLTYSIGTMEENNPPPIVPSYLKLIYPDDNATNTSYTVQFGFWVNDSYSSDNCSLFTNESGNWQNEETIYADIHQYSNITHTFSANGSYLWTIRCLSEGYECEYDNACAENRTLNIAKPFPPYVAGVCSITTDKAEYAPSEAIIFTWQSSDYGNGHVTDLVSGDPIYSFAADAAGIHAFVQNYQIGSFAVSVDCSDGSSDLATFRVVALFNWFPFILIGICVILIFIFALVRYFT